MCYTAPKCRGIALIDDEFTSAQFVEWLKFQLACGPNFIARQQQVSTISMSGVICLEEGPTVPVWNPCSRRISDQNTTLILSISKRAYETYRRFKIIGVCMALSTSAAPYTPRLHPVTSIKTRHQTLSGNIRATNLKHSAAQSQ